MDIFPSKEANNVNMQDYPDLINVH
jgi:hypothetical protein